MNETFWKGFCNPPRICAQSPFWFLNDAVDGGVYVSQIEEMANKGVMQVMPHPRYGMDRREYLTPRYLDAFERMVERAAELGMAVNLYDDFNWSSGQCGGRIPADRRLCALGLAMNCVHVCGDSASVKFESWTDGFGGWAQFEDVLLAGWAPCVSDTELDFEQLVLAPDWRLDGGRLTIRVPAGDYTVFVIYTVRTVHISPLREGNGGIIDYLGEKPAREFIRRTHEVYYEKLGRYFGSTIQSIFSDEIGPYACGDFTWSDDFPAYFRKHKGYDIAPFLPMLYFDGSPSAPKVRCDYWDAVTMAYQDHFMRPIADWCRAHGIASTGHTYEESRLWTISGNMYESMRTQMWVGVDSLLGYKPYSMIKPCISAAHATGRKTALCEAVGVLGEEIGEHGSWTCSPRQVKYAYNQLGVAGVSLMAPHAFFQSVDNPKAECPPSFFKDNHYWRYYQDIERLTEIMCYINRETEHVADVAVFYPIVSWWSLSRGGRGRGMPSSIPRDREIDSYRESSVFDDLIDGLMRRQLDHDVLDLKALEESDIQSGKLVLHGETYRALVLPPMSCARTSTLRRLNTLAGRGVPIFCLGHFAPTASMEHGEGDAFFSSLVSALTPHITEVDDIDALERRIRESVTCDITLLEGDRDALDAAHRHTRDTDIYLLSNLRDEASQFTLRLRVRARHGRLLDSLTRSLDASLEYCPDYVLARVTLPAEELCYLVLSEEPVPGENGPERTVQAGRVPSVEDVPGWRYTPAPGFDSRFTYGALPMQELAVPVGKTIEQSDSTGDTAFFSSWMRADYDDSHWQQVTLKRTKAVYSHKNSQFFRFVIPAGACALRLPFPSDCEYALYVNGEACIDMLDFQEAAACWLPLAGCERTSGLLGVETASMRPGFGLTGAPVFLMKPFKTPLRPWSEWGVGWYSGFAVYDKRFYIHGAAKGELWLDLGDVRECCEVWINGQCAGHRIWPPYRLEISPFVKPGENRMRVAVCNLMSNEYSWDILGSRGTGRRLPSGLTGPVSLGGVALE